MWLRAVDRSLLLQGWQVIKINWFCYFILQIGNVANKNVNSAKVSSPLSAAALDFYLHFPHWHPQQPECTFSMWLNHLNTLLCEILFHFISQSWTQPIRNSNGMPSNGKIDAKKNYLFVFHWNNKICSIKYSIFRFWYNKVSTSSDDGGAQRPYRSDSNLHSTSLTTPMSLFHSWICFSAAAPRHTNVGKAS